MKRGDEFDGVDNRVDIESDEIHGHSRTSDAQYV